jgi:hypothetical protein
MSSPQTPTVGFVGALRRSELVALDLDSVAEHPNGVVLTLPRSKTNPTGEQAQLVVLPRGGDSRRCAVTAVRSWTEAGEQHLQPQPRLRLSTTLRAQETTRRNDAGGGP